MTDDRKIVTTGKRSLTIQHGTGAANVIDQVLSDALALARSSEVSKEAFTEINGIMFDQLSVQQLEIWAKTVVFDENWTSDNKDGFFTLLELVELLEECFLEHKNNPWLRSYEHWVHDGQIRGVCFVNLGLREGELDLSKVPMLNYLFVDSIYLDQLDLSNNPELTRITIETNQLTQLDVSNNPMLASLEVPPYQLTQLDVSNNLMLTSLICRGYRMSRLTQLDVSNNLKLMSLVVDANQLTQLDVSNNPKLRKLLANNNPLTSLRLSNEIDLENLPGIKIPANLKFDKVKGCYTNE
jgi:hypothetical protein